tara:strand:+ start:932 stop:1117 length:186 start_codon:yes stop_codon:yes gene_type:complete
MPKSRNRKNHKKKVAARKVRVESQQKQMIKQLEDIKDKYSETQGTKESESTGDVPFTLGDK